MEFYLDSANIQEIETAFKLGFLDGLTTTPTFMHREGITNIDDTIVRLSKIVPVLQIEALGKSAEEIYDEAQRIIDLGLDKSKTVFKIPISLEGARACKMLRNKDFMVNLHLIYTVQQAYVALSAGATYVCPLVGRLQDQGHDALAVIEQTVKAVEKYNYPSKVMFSSVRHPEHVRNALSMGAHTCTIPWKVMRKLPDNYFTDIGTQEFFEHTKLMTQKVKDVLRTEQTLINYKKTVFDALMKMTVSKLGAIIVVDDNYNTYRIFTDGDLRRVMETSGEAGLQTKFSDLERNNPVSVDIEDFLYNASKIFKANKIDNIVVTQNQKPVGILDIHDLL